MNRRRFLSGIPALLGAVVISIKEMKSANAITYSAYYQCYAYWQTVSTTCEANIKYTRQRLCCWQPGSYCTGTYRTVSSVGCNRYA